MNTRNYGLVARDGRLEGSSIRLAHAVRDIHDNENSVLLAANSPPWRSDLALVERSFIRDDERSFACTIFVTAFLSYPAIFAFGVWYFLVY